MCVSCAALPLAGLLAVVVRRRVPAVVSAALGAVLLGSVVALILRLPTAGPQSLSGPVLRGTLALSAAVSVMLFLTAFLPARRLGPRVSPVRAVALGVLGLAALFLLPATYIQARGRHDLVRLTDLLEQSRLGEARALLGRLLALQPSAELEGHPLREVAAELERMVRELESRVAAPLAASATDEARLQRAGISRSWDAPARPSACCKRSAKPPLHPKRTPCTGRFTKPAAEWKTARKWYARAEQIWQLLPPSPERAAGLRQVIRGVAFCERKSGRNREAEAAYLKLLALSPTADSHFLLARFYEDTQQTAQAHFHARRAMMLAPERYREPGRKLIEKLVTLHFGCLGVFRD